MAQPRGLKSAVSRVTAGVPCSYSFVTLKGFESCEYRAGVPRSQCSGSSVERLSIRGKIVWGWSLWSAHAG